MSLSIKYGIGIYVMIWGGLKISYNMYIYYCGM